MLLYISGVLLTVGAYHAETLFSNGVGDRVVGNLLVVFVNSILKFGCFEEGVEFILKWGWP